MPELFPYQRDGVHFLRACTAAHGAAILADDCGVGKTPQFLSAPPDGAPVIVSVPAALKAQTAERIVQWRGTRTPVRIIDGVGSFAAPRAGEWIVTNPDLLPAAPSEVAAAERAIAAAEDSGELPLDAGKTIDAAAASRALERLAKRGKLARGSFAAGTWFIADEAHEFNTFKSAQTKRVRAVIAAVLAAGGKVIGATATPLLNEPSELRAFLATFRLGGVAWPAKTGRALDYWSFLRDWGGSKGRFGEEWAGDPSCARIVAALSRVMLRRRLRDVADLPPMLPTESVHVDLEAGVRELADEAALELRTRDLARGERIVFETCSKVRAALAVAKIPAALAWCDRMEREGEPAVVACVSRDVVKAIGRRNGWAVIDGTVPDAKRHAIVTAFQSGGLRGVALTHRAGGVGIDLYRAARLLIVSREWNPALNRQTLARLLRQGQERAVGLTMLYGAHPIEERLDELVGRRKRYMAAIDGCSVRPGVAA